VTTNQWRAASLAARICQRHVDPSEIPERDWHLLLLAADLRNPGSLPLLVCCRVLDQAARGLGYFASTSPPEAAGAACDDDPPVDCRLNVRRINDTQAEDHSPDHN
jgi:hypothetical protein